MDALVFSAKLIFWAAALTAAYTYAGYPLLIAAWARWRPRGIKRAAIAPTITVVIAAHNEEARIDAKLASCFALDYPRALMDVIVVSDGSTDKTDEIVTRLCAGHENLALVALPSRRGKAAAINAALSAAKGEIIIFTDARQALSRDAARALVANFADDTVGAVSGELVFVDEQHRPQMGGVGFYWRYEKWLRKCEAAVHSVCGATGALYAIRRKLVEPLPEGLVLDDVLVPMRAVLAGYRAVFDENAIVYDRLAVSAGNEFQRKVRTLYGNYQLLAIEPRLLLPSVNPVCWQLFSHKVCRLIVPFCLIAMFVFNLFLTTGIYGLILLMQTGWYLLALAGYLMSGAPVTEAKET